MISECRNDDRTCRYGDLWESQFLTSRAKKQFNKPDLAGLSLEAIKFLGTYHWTDNVRQLRAIIRRYVFNPPTRCKPGGNERRECRLLIDRYIISPV